MYLTGAKVTSTLVLVIMMAPRPLQLVHGQKIETTEPILCVECSYHC